MTILQAINNIETGLDTFTSVYGTNDPNAQTMLDLAREAGEEISRRCDWRDMLKYYVAVLSPTQLPVDFQRLTPGGSVRTQAGEFVRPVANSGQWDIVVLVPSAQPYYFLINSSMYFSPTAAGVNATISYVSVNWIKADDGSEVSDWTSDDDSVLFPQRLLEKGILWRWRRKEGLDYADQLAEFEADLAAEIKANRGV